MIIIWLTVMAYHHMLGKGLIVARENAGLYDEISTGECQAVENSMIRREYWSQEVFHLAL
jgi:hypothetical protein